MHEILASFQALPDIGKKVSKLEEEAALLDASGEVMSVPLVFSLALVIYMNFCFLVQAEVAEYHKLKLDIAQLEKKLMSEITRPERVLYYLGSGRLVCAENNTLVS